MKTKLLALILLAGGSLFAHSHWSVGVGVGFGAPVVYPHYGYYAPVSYGCARPAYAYRSYWYPRYHYSYRTRYVYPYRTVRYYPARYYRRVYYSRPYCRRY